MDTTTKETQTMYVRNAKKVAIFVDWENVRKEIEDITRDNLYTNLSYEDEQALRQKENLDYVNVQDIMSIIQKPVDKNSEDIFQTFVYDINPLSLNEEQKRLEKEKEELGNICKELQETSNSSGYTSDEQYYCNKRYLEITPILNKFDKCKDASEEQVKKIRESHRELMKQDCLKLRLDTQKFLCFNKCDDSPILGRNQINMIFVALDIAHIAYNKLADEIIVFSKNEDIIPALECARTNGLHVSLVRIKEWDFIEEQKEKWQITEKLRRHANRVREISLLEIIKDKKSKEQ